MANRRYIPPVYNRGKMEYKDARVYDKAPLKNDIIHLRRRTTMVASLMHLKIVVTIFWRATITLYCIILSTFVDLFLYLYGLGKEKSST